MALTKARLLKHDLPVHGFVYSTFSTFLRVFCSALFRKKSLMSVIFPPAILGPEMAARILWAPRIFSFFVLENPHAHKILPFGGGGFLGFFRRGGGSANFIFMGAWIFPIFRPRAKRFGGDLLSTFCGVSSSKPQMTSVRGPSEQIGKGKIVGSR